VGPTAIRLASGCAGVPPEREQPMDQPEPPSLLCPHCGAGNDVRATVCSACDRPLILVIADDPWRAPGEPPFDGRFRISSLMVVIGVLAICLGLIREVPGLAVVLMILAVPALARTIGGITRRRRSGRPVTWNDRLGLFGGSLAVVAVILTASVIAFTVTCFPTGLLIMQANEGIGLALGILGGLACAGFSAFFLIRRLWPVRDL
jgi:hypothetical protein